MSSRSSVLQGILKAQAQPQEDILMKKRIGKPRDRRNHLNGSFHTGHEPMWCWCYLLVNATITTIPGTMGGRGISNFMYMPQGFMWVLSAFHFKKMSGIAVSAPGVWCSATLNSTFWSSSRNQTSLVSGSEVRSVSIWSLNPRLECC